MIIPRVGGDTMWANTEAAYDDLPDHLRTLADGLWVQHSNKADYGGMTSAGQSYTSAFHSAAFAARHPLVRVHPVSGRRSLLLGGFASRIEGRLRAGVGRPDPHVPVVRDTSGEHGALAVPTG